MHGALLLSQEELKEPVTGKADSSGYSPFSQPRNVWSSQKAFVSVRIRSTDCKRLSRSQGDKIKKNSLLLSGEVAVGRVIRLTAESGKLLPSFKDYKVSKKHLAQKVSGQQILR